MRPAPKSEPAPITIKKNSDENLLLPGRESARFVHVHTEMVKQSMPRKATNPFALVLVTAPDRKCARRLAQKALQARLIACANLVTSAESHYWWQGKITRGTEVLLLLKTTAARLRKLEQTILEHHPYDTPEFVVLPVTAGNERYLDWWREAVA